ncbi:hypothetical protein [Agrobacterium fabrum]|uniref:hypothetical protein n=1 Tax=Agrobacterium fabrum TaxID=1176649 RepID=UPI002485F89A|nr:hypothetical protein [Agrobacterium fabrum]
MVIATGTPERLVSKTFECWAEMRYVGQSFQVDVRLPDTAIEAHDIAAMHAAFHQEHERIYSHADKSGASRIRRPAHARAWIDVDTSALYT